MKFPTWLPRPSSIFVAVLAGGIIGAIEGRADERRRRAAEESEVWAEAGIPESVESPRSSNGSTNTGNGSTADSGVPLSELPPMALHEQITDKEENQ